MSEVNPHCLECMAAFRTCDRCLKQIAALDASGLVLKVGDLAFYDGWSGLVPVKVLAIATGVHSNDPKHTKMAAVRVTAARKAYGKRGEILRVHASNVIPRKAIHGQYRNRIHPYRVAATSTPKEYWDAR